MTSSNTFQVLRNFLNMSITAFLLFFITVNLVTLAQVGLERLGWL
jgi:hypothetical protein